MATKDNVQGVVLALFGASAGGHLAGLTAAATANGLTAVAGDLAASAGFILGRDLSTAAAFRDNMLTGLGITSTNSAYAAAAAWANGELAKAGANRGEIVASAVNFLAGLTDATSPFYAVATAYRATVTAAVTWSEGAGATVFGVAALQAQQGTSGGVGSTFALTTSADTFVGTTGSDTFTASQGALNSTDVILDATSTDADVLTATVTANNLTPRIQNVETINLDGKFLTTGIALTNVTGATNLNLNSALAGGTATVTDANSLNALNINAGAKISTLSVTSLASGTRDAVTIDSNAATALNITGVATGADTYVASVAADATVTLATVDASDSVTLNLAGDASLASVAALGDLIINADEADAVVALTVGSAADTLVTGSKNVTIQSASALFDAKGLTSTNTGTVTLELGTVTDDDLLNEVVVDVVEFTAAMTDTDVVTVNENSVINLTASIAATTEVATIDIDNVDLDLAAASGTMILNVSESQAGIVKAGANVGTVLLTATPDEDSDTEDGAVITLGTGAATDGLNMNAATALVVQGSADLTITKLTNVTGGVIDATTMTGDLTIGVTTATVTAALGSGDDAITLGAFAATVYAGAGDDAITTAGALNTIYGEDGNDTITTSSLDETISGGAGDDLIIVAAASDDKTVSLGDGADTVRIAVDGALNTTDASVTISDFVLGTDKLLLTGVSTDTSIDLTSITPSSGVYTIGTDDWLVKLTGNTATDLSDSVQLGSSKYLFTAAASSTVVAGDLADAITAAATSDVTLTLGGGADTVYKTANSDGVTTVTDFVLGEDKIVLIGTSADAIDLATATTVTDGAYNVNTTSDQYQFVLEDMTTTDLASFVQLGDANNTFTAKPEATTVGGDFADYISVTGSATTSGATVITGGLGADKVTFAGAGDKETLTIAAGDSLTTAWDELTGYESSSTALAKDVINLPSTNLATVVGSTAVGDITGITISGGVVTAWAGIDDTSGTVDATMLTAAIAFLSANIGGTDTVAFGYTSDENGDGDTDDTGENSTFIFQNGTTETLVELIGLSGITSLTASATTSTTQIVIA